MAGGCVGGGDPGFLDKVSFIKRYALDQCSTPWRVYLQTGGRALGNLAMTMLWMDTADLARSFFRPKGSRSWRHAMPWQKKGKGRISKGLFPEPSDLVADTTRSITGLKKPIYSDGFNHMWTVDTHLQRVLNHVLFVNMATDFAYDWFSGIVKSTESKCQIGRFRQLYTFPAVTNGFWTMGLQEGDPYYDEGVLIGQNQIVIEEGTWLFECYTSIAYVAGDQGMESRHLIFVGPVEDMKPCGKMDVKVLPGPGKTIESRLVSVVKGPCIVRVMRSVIGASATNPAAGTTSFWSAFRLD